MLAMQDRGSAPRPARGNAPGPRYLNEMVSKGVAFGGVQGSAPAFLRMCQPFGRLV